MAKFNISNTKNGTKEIISYGLSGELIYKLKEESLNQNLSASEIVEYACRILFKMPTDECKSKLAAIYKN